MNLAFRYMYRDCGNWKNFGSVIFGNGYGLSTEDIQRRVMRTIDVDQLIDAEILKLPPLYFHTSSYDPELDHPAHEFLEISETNAPVDDLKNRDITELLAAMTRLAPHF